MNHPTCRGTVIGLLVFCLAAPGLAADTLTLQQALVLGVANNYDLRIARLDVERAAAGVTGSNLKQIETGDHGAQLR